MKTIKTISLTSFVQERERVNDQTSSYCQEGGQWLTNHNDQLLIDYCRQDGEF